MDELLQRLFGPEGLLAASLIAVGVLWREDRRVYKERIEDIKLQRDVATAGWKAQTDANAVLAADIANRRRKTDSG